jgi:predicted O-methyltransferase YrrM
MYTRRAISIEDEIESLYVKYKDGLQDLHTWMVRWNEIKKDIVDICHPGMCIEESELLYLRIRESQPLNVIEIGPACGWSSLVIITALVHNKQGTLYSFDIENKAPKILNSDPFVAAHIANRWEIRTGWVEKTYPRAFATVGKW